MTPPRDLVRTVRDELATPGRYRLTFSSPHQRRSWVGDLVGWVGDRYADFLRAIEHRVHVGPGTSAAIGDAIVVACIIVVGIVAARLLIAMQIERNASGASEALQAQRSAHALALEAMRAANEGAFVAAVRAIFAAAVVLLDLRGVVSDDAGATINELRAVLHERDVRAEGPFIDIARIYSAAVYAEEPIGEPAWAHARDAYERLHAAVQPT